MKILINTNKDSNIETLMQMLTMEHFLKESEKFILTKIETDCGLSRILNCYELDLTLESFCDGIKIRVWCVLHCIDDCIYNYEITYDKDFTFYEIEYEKIYK